ncbi:MAG: dTDP-4-dehydrorhamnose 3,5-epimerase [Gammaproteobacteria bacterium]
MKFTETRLPGVITIEPAVFGDSRGFFMETWEERKFAEAGIHERFVQDNYSSSRRGILRGIHYQIKQPQGKLVRVTSGAVFDVVVDLRRSSSHFGEWYGTELSADNKKMMWVPPGFGHGFFVVSEQADFAYKCTDFYASEHERNLVWNDPDVGIEWPSMTQNEPTLSDNDRNGQLLSEAELYP